MFTDGLETRTMLSVSAVIGPTASPSATTGSAVETFNLQLQPGSAQALSQLMPVIAAEGATVAPTTVSGLYTVQAPPRTWASLPRISRPTRRSSTLSPVQTFQIQTVPNDTDYVNGDQWQLNGTWGVNALRGLERHDRVRSR